MEAVFDKKFNETIIIRDGKPIYAVSLNSNKKERNENATFIYIHNGKVHFSDSWLSGKTEFDLGKTAHRIAKEMFVSQLQVDIKCRILELKQLEEVFNEIGLQECFGSVLVDNSKMLAEISNDISETRELMEAIDGKVDEIQNSAENTVKDAIRDSVKSIALKRDNPMNRMR